MQGISIDPHWGIDQPIIHPIFQSFLCQCFQYRVSEDFNLLVRVFVICGVWFLKNSSHELCTCNLFSVHRILLILMMESYWWHIQTWPLVASNNQLILIFVANILRQFQTARFTNIWQATWNPLCNDIDFYSLTDCCI